MAGQQTRKESLAREERLAAKLRENLRRRKAQARALDSHESETPAPPLPKAGEDS